MRYRAGQVLSLYSAITDYNYIIERIGGCDHHNGDRAASGGDKLFFCFIAYHGKFNGSGVCRQVNAEAAFSIGNGARFATGYRNGYAFQRTLIVVYNAFQPPGGLCGEGGANNQG